MLLRSELLKKYKFKLPTFKLCQYIKNQYLANKIMICRGVGNINNGQIKQQ